MKVHRALTVALLVPAAAIAAACSNTSQQTTEVRASPTPSPTASATSGPTSEIGRTAGEAADKAADKAKQVGDKIVEESKDVAATLAFEKQVLDVKAGLMADKAIDASKIDVDGDRSAKTITLKGSVPTTAQKSAAEKVARSKAEGYTVKNQLTVAAK
jgi:osmotically-inducible protein OsmY